MTTTGHITPAVRRYYRPAVADGNRAFAVELVGNAASRARRAYIAARDADDFNSMAYQEGAMDAIACILATIAEEDVEAARAAAEEIAAFTADAVSNDLRSVGAHNAATNAIDSLSIRMATSPTASSRETHMRRRFMTKDVLGEALRAQVRQAGNAVSVLREAARDAVDEQQPDALLGIAVDYTAARGEQAAAMRITSAYEAGGLVEARRVAQIVADEHLSLGPDDPLGVRVFCDGADKRSGIIADSLLY